jgi:L-ascorbate metabolism protein UlaG (beta-lactamase superfamily)
MGLYKDGFMKITKFGHCCLLIEESGLRILTDPGEYSTRQNKLKNIDIVMITHEHTDHCDIGSVKAMLQNNPEAKIITNTSVGTKLLGEGIRFSILENGQSSTEKGVLIEALGQKHAIIYPGLPIADNTGYFIGNRLFDPGDAFTVPSKSVEIMALPVAGPWIKLSEGIDYAKRVKPKICFPIHDGGLKKLGTTNNVPPKFLEPLGIKFVVLPIGKAVEF